MIRLDSIKSFLIKTALFIIGLPSADGQDKETIAVFNKWCQLSELFGATMNGYKRYSSATQDAITSFHRKNVLIRFCNIISFIRLTLLLFIENESVSIYGGDGLFRNKQRVLSICIMLLALVIGFFAREIFVSLEAKSNGEIYFCFECFHDGFNYLNLQMTPSRAINHRYIIHFFSVFWLRFMYFLIPCLMILFNLPIIINPFFYRIPIYTIFCIFWSISLTLAIIFDMVGFASISAYCIMSGLYYLNRLESICSVALHATNKGTEIEDDFVISLILRFISHSNKVDHFLDVLAFLILYYILAISFLGDLLIFAGLIVRLHSDVIANICSFIGIFIMTLLALACYTEGSFLTKLYLLYRKLHIFNEYNMKMKTKLKIIEAMDRIIGPYNGVKAGDLAVISKHFFVIFLLENASTLMLITVNSRSFLE